MGFSPTRARTCVWSACGRACVFEARPYRASGSEQSNSRGKRVKQLGPIEGKVTAHLILSALLLYKRFWKEEKPLKRCRPEKNQDKEKSADERRGL